ncbi:hypothetical protein II906_05395 [bacterium]|nr:hypothetical protein [bacterium]
MINGVQFQGISSMQNGKLTNGAQPIKPEGDKRQAINQLMDANMAASLKPMSFKGHVHIKNDKDNGLRINDFVDMKDDITITEPDIGTSVISRKDNSLSITYTNTKGKTQEVFRAEADDLTKLPELTYKVGKFNPEIMVKDASLGNARLQMLAGSEVRTKDYTLIMPEVKKAENKPSFKGRTVITCLKSEDRTKEAVENYLNSGLTAGTTPGYYAEEMKKYDPTLVIPAGGFGTRFANFTVEDDQNKPSAFLPTNPNYRILATSLNMGAMAGLIGNHGDKLDYVSQSTDKRALQSAPNVYKSKEYKTDGGAISEAIREGVIPENKDMVIVNADIITNVDITRAYHALKTLPDAAVVIPYYPVDQDRARSFGLIGIKEDDQGNKKIHEFIEKPQFTTNVPNIDDFKPTDNEKTYEKAVENHEKARDLAKIYDTEDGGAMYYGNPGIYVFSKEATQKLAEFGIKDANSTTGLGGKVVPKLVEMCRKGELTNAEGKPMKVYTVPLQRADGKEGFWDDIGSAEAYMKTIKDIAVETAKKGTGVENTYYGIPSSVLEDFRDNFDFDTSVLYRSPSARAAADNFKKVNDATLKGNILVAD